MKNKIKDILHKKNISIRKLSMIWNKPYAYTYNLVNKDDISTITLGTLQELAHILNTDIKDLYE